MTKYYCLQCDEFVSVYIDDFLKCTTCGKETIKLINDSVFIEEIYNEQN